MGKVEQVGRGAPASSKNKSGVSKSPSSVVLLIFKSFPSNNFLIVLSLAATYWSAIPAHANFKVPGTSYNCSSNLICLGSAHVFNGTGNSQIPHGRLSLIPETRDEGFYKAGIAYYKKPVKLLDLSTNTSVSFSTSFVIDITNDDTAQGDGITFVISADNSTVGGNGSSLGIFTNFGNGTVATTFKSIVVEFDTFENPTSPVFDINANHVSFDFMNIKAAVAEDAGKANVHFLEFSSRTFYAWVDYSNETQHLEARVSYYDSKPSKPLLTYAVDLFEVVEEYMWVGFSSGSGAYSSNYYVGDWTFRSNGKAVPTATSGGSKVGIIVGLSVGIPAFLIACIVIALSLQRISGVRGLYRYCQQVWMGFREEDETMQIEGMPERFSYKQLCVATRHFSEESKLGQGGFGSVHRGVLPSSGISVAVKRISSDSSQGEKEFMAEVSIISRLRHRNLIQLLGWCERASKGKYLLVYELMPNGSLDKALFSRSTERQTVCLSWEQRFNIVTGMAAAVDYLHQGWTQQVIHRDIKSSNIMLDEEWNAKLGDFGLARLVDHQREAATTLVAGTYGYIAPEVAATGRFTDKSDVYAFGAVVLEVACGRKALATYLPEDEMILADWVWHCLSEGSLMSTVDKRLEDYDAQWMEVVLIIGLLCSHPNPLARPTMRHVVQVLAGDVPLPSIPLFKPAMFRSNSSSISIDSSHIRSTESTPRSRFGSISSPASMTTNGSIRGSVVKSSSISMNSSSPVRVQIRSPVGLDQSVPSQKKQ